MVTTSTTTTIIAIMPSKAGSMIEDGQTVEQVLCMNAGDGRTSYSKNSALQRKVISGAKEILEESVMQLIRNTNFLSTNKSLGVADLGCATGPNALLAVSEIVYIICRTCEDHRRPSFLLYLNDLPSNDFNTIFRSLSGFSDSIRRVGAECFVMAVPGSFYGRLFPSKSLHFVHSTYALHWLSQVPKGLVGPNGEALNKGNIYIAQTSSPAVHKAYNDQFTQDFNAFLKSRSEELMPRANMVLTFLGSAITNNTPFNVYEVIGLTLADMAKQGLISEIQLDMFNLPFHAASVRRIREVINDEGSFRIQKLKVLKTRWDAGIDEDDKRVNAYDGVHRGRYVAKYMRAVSEPLLVAEFGEGIMDELFKRVAVKFTEVLNNARDCHYDSIVVSLTRNASIS